MVVYLYNITILPAVMSSAPMMTRLPTGSLRNRNDRQMVITTLSLSTGATRDTSPYRRALKQKSHDTPVAAPDSTKNSHVWPGIDLMSLAWVPTRAMPHVKGRMMVVRIAVARSESTSFTPILAKIAVRAAKKADSNA